MAITDLGAFIGVLEEHDELRRVRVQVSPKREIAEIVDRVSKAGGPALLFERVAGSEFPVAVNLFGSARRMALALGVQDVEEIADRLRGLLALARPGKRRSVLGMVPQLGQLLRMPPRHIRGKAPVQEVVWRDDEVDLRKLPLLTAWPEDVGPFITLPQVITADPVTGGRNVGVYRAQLHGPRELGLHWERHKGGAGHHAASELAGTELPVAIALGGDPAAIYAASAPLPEGIDEYVFAGFLRRQPVELCRAISVELDVPARAEMVIEGVVRPGEVRAEGPFGDHTGFYDPGGPYPVMHVTAVTMRSHPVYPASVVGRPPMEEHWLVSHTSERIFLPLIQMILPEIVDVHAPPEGVATNLLLVSIKKRYPGQAYKVASGLLGTGLLALTKVVVVVDDWVDVRHPGDAWWAALCNADPQRDLLIGRGPTSVLDHASESFSVGGKLVIDGTCKWPEEGGRQPWPRPIAMDAEMVGQVTRRWVEYGLGDDPGPSLRGARPAE